MERLTVSAAQDPNVYVVATFTRKSYYQESKLLLLVVIADEFELAIVETPAETAEEVTDVVKVL